MSVPAEVRWAPVDGLVYGPDVAVRAWATRVIGTQEMDLTVGGADLQLSRGFGVAGMVKLQPYLQGGMVFVNSGYPRFGGAPGNVLLAFGIDK